MGSQLQGPKLLYPYAESDQTALMDQIIIEPQHDKTNKMACAPGEDSDLPGHPPSLIRVCAQRKAKDPRFLHAGSQDADQTGQTPRLI